MRRYAKITPEGTKDFLFEECAARAAIQNALTQVFRKWQYQPVITPHMEFYDVFHRDSADWLSEKLYGVTDSSGRLLVLRPDSTLPIARVASTRLREAAFPLRLYYHQSVFRRASFYSGHSDETYQCGVELIGAQGLRADMELLYCAVDALRNCDISARFRIELGHAGVFRALTECMGLEEETRAELVHCIERKNVPALRKLLCRIDDCAHSEALLALPKLFGGKETLARAKALLRAKQAQEALEYLSVLYQALCEANLQDVIDIDLSLVHGQEYYTGLVFRGYMEGSGETVLSGGRYDALLAEFGRPAAAVGFAVEVDALAKGMLAHGGFEKQEAQVLVFGAEGFETAALRHGDSLCGEGGAPAEVSLSQSLEEAVLYAKTKGIGRLDIIDENGLRTERTEDL